MSDEEDGRFFWRALVGAEGMPRREAARRLTEVHGADATSRAEANVVAGGLFLGAHAKELRKRLGHAAGIIRRTSGLRDAVAAIRDAIPAIAAPDTQDHIVEFLARADAAVVALEEAVAALPPSTRRSRAKDEVDGAPSLARMNGEIAGTAPLPGLGAPLRDLGVAAGIEPPPRDSVDDVRSRDEWAKRKRRKLRHPSR